MAIPGPSLRRLGILGATGTLATGSVAALLTALSAPAAAATTYTVDDASDGAPNAADCTDGTPGNCSLRDAIAAANDGDTIVFAPGITSITVVNGTLLTDAVSVLGPGSSALTITTAAAAGSYDLFDFGGTGNATLSGVTVQRNRISSDVDLIGDLTLTDVIVEDSRADNGGGLYTRNIGDVLITNSTFRRNMAANSGDGGAIELANTGNANISDSAFVDNTADNSAGAIDVSSTLLGDFSLVRSSITGNSAGNYAGGLYTDNGGDVTIADSTISDNTCEKSSGGGGYLSSGGYLTITNTTVMGNYAHYMGGGLYIAGFVSATITDSTIADNGAGGGGAGIKMSNDLLTIANTTISGNRTSHKGGALYTQGGTIHLLQSTITANRAIYAGGGLQLKDSTDIHLSGTILAGNITSGLPNSVAAITPDDISATTTGTVSSDHSVLGTIGTPAEVTLTDEGGTIRADDPEVEALADNGGPTMTMALMATSPAIDAGPDPVPTFPGNEYDQRGPGFTRIAFGRADIGAYEIQEPPAPEPEPVVPAFTG